MISVIKARCVSLKDLKKLLTLIAYYHPCNAIK